MALCQRRNPFSFSVFSFYLVLVRDLGLGSEIQAKEGRLYSVLTAIQTGSFVFDVGLSLECCQCKHYLDVGSHEKAAIACNLRDRSNDTREPSKACFVVSVVHIQTLDTV